MQSTPKVGRAPSRALFGRGSAVEMRANASSMMSVPRAASEFGAAKVPIQGARSPCQAWFADWRPIDLAGLDWR